MSDKTDKIGNIQTRTTLGITLGLACTIPLAAPAMARPDADQIAARQALRLQNQAARAERREIRLQNLAERGGTNFNLNSGRAVFSAGNLGTFTNLTINVGGKDKVIDLNSKLTAAELVAAQQILNSGSQSIQLSRNGAAAGGTIALNTNVLTGLESSVGGNISSMTVARGVQVVDNNSGIDLSGTLRNFGTISAANTVSGSTNTIAADVIINGRGGSIESYNGVDLHAADVALNAATSLTNNGSISSAGNLTITAPVIRNVADGNSSPTMTAANSINLNTSNLLNNGLIAANAGNINVTAPGALLAGGTGTLQADNGDISFDTTNSDITVTGGNLLSQNVNFNSGLDGKVSATFGEATGFINAEGCVIHLYADTQDLKLGTITAFGDPIITNTGNISINAAITATNGAPLTLIAGGNITSAAGNVGLDTSSAVGDGGDLSLIAGATFKTDKKTGNITVSKKSKTGGLIDLTGGNGGSAPITSIDTSSATGQAGDVMMVAFAAKTVGSGQVILPGGVTIDATGADGNGTVTLIGSVKEGQAVTVGGINAGAVTIGSGTPGSPKGGVQFNPTTGELLTAPFFVKSASNGQVNLNGSISASGDVNITTGGVLEVLGTLETESSSTYTTIAAGSLNVGATGSILSDDNQIVNATVSGAVQIDGEVSVGQLNLNAGSLTLSTTGRLEDAVDNITIKKGNIVNAGTFGRTPGEFDPTRPTTTFNVVTGGSFINEATGNISGNGLIQAATFQNDGEAIGNIEYTATSKKAGGFVNNGLIDGLAVIVNAAAIQNNPGAFLQATLQTNEDDIPTLVLNTQSINNLGQIGALGAAKESEGVLSINSTKGLTITGVDGGFFTDFNSTVSLTAAGDIVIGGNDGVVNSNPFSNINNNLGVFNVETTGTFKSTLTNIDVTANADGDYGEINILAKGFQYNGLGVAPVYNFTATGNPEVEGAKPVTIQITGKQGITLGGDPGNFNVVVTGYDPTSINSFITPTNLNVNMANLVLNGTGLNLEGTKNLLINGNIVGGEIVTITTANKKAFLVGNATNNGQTGIGLGEGITATKTLTINAPGNIDIGSGAILGAGEDVILNAAGLIVEAGGDITAGSNPSELKVTLNTGASSKAIYENLNLNGFLSAAILEINATGTLTLSSGGGNQNETRLSIGQNADVADGVAGGGSFIINAGALKFSSRGIFFDASSPSPATPNGGTVEITLATTKTVKVGLGNGAIRADVTADNQSSAEGAGRFLITSVGAIQAENVTTGAVAFGDGGSFGLRSSTSTVSASDVTGKGYNLFQLSSNSSTTLSARNAGKNGVKDAAGIIGGGNIVFTNNGGAVDTNGAILLGVQLNLTASTDVDVRDNEDFSVFADSDGNGGVINITAARLLVNNANEAGTGLTIFAYGGATTGATVNITTTDTSTAGNLTIDAPNTRGAIAIDVSGAVGMGASVNVTSGNILRVSGNGLDFGSAANSDGSSLTLTSGQATTTGYKGGNLVFNDGNAAGLEGLAFGTVTFNSGSQNTFLLNGANANNGNGFSASGSTLAAGKIVINPLGGLGTIDMTGYSLVTNALEITAGEVRFANQTIAVVADGLLGSGDNTGNGGSIDITATNMRFSNQGGVLLQAQANAAIATSVGGTISIDDASTRVLNLDANGLSFDVSNAGAGAAGSISVDKAGNNLVVDGTALTFGNNDGGTLDLSSSRSMLISNVAAISTAFLDKITLETNGTDGPFQFGSATNNGFVDVNPTLSATEVQISTAGANAGIDTSTGTVSANIIGLKTTGNINFASGGGLTALSNTTNNNGGSIYLTAAALTQSGGNAGFTLDASSGGLGGAGGIVDVNITGSGTLDIGTGGLNVDVSNDGIASGGGLINVSNGGNINADMDGFALGSNFGGAGPTISVIANGILSVANAASIANIGLGGGQFTAAGVQGEVKVDNFQTITIVNALLPGGQLEITYVNQGNDTVASIAQAFGDLINSNQELQDLGVSAIVDGANIQLRSTAAGTSYNITYNPDQEFYNEDGDPILEIDLTTFTSGLTFGSRSSQAFVLGGAAAGSNGIQDNGVNFNVAAINIFNTGLATTATVGGGVRVGTTDTIIVTDSRLAGGFVEVSYTFVEGDTRETVAASLANAVNTNVALQAIGVTASADDDVINLLAVGKDTSFTTEAGKGSKLTLATVAEGGDILNGTLGSLTGAATTGPAVLTASGNVGAPGDGIILNSGAGSINVNAGLDAHVVSNNSANNVTVNVDGTANIMFTAGNVGSVSGTAGALNFLYDGANGNGATIGLGGFATTNGDLVFAGNANTFNVSGAISSGQGNVVIQNTSTNGGANINIAASTTILGSGAVTAQNQGNVYIVMGDLPPAFTPADGVQPAGTTVIETVGGQVTFGSTAFPAGSIDADASAIFQALGRDLVFSTNGLPNSAITVGADVVITADPPAQNGTVAGILARIAAQNGRTSTYGTQSATTSVVSTNAQSSVSTASIGTVTADLSGVSAASLAGGVSTPSTMQSAANNVLSALNTTAANSSLTSLTNAGRTADLSSIQYTTLSSATNRDTTSGVAVMGLGGTRSSALQQALAGEADKQAGTATLQGEVSNVQHRRLERGPLLVAPQVDLVVDTPHGSVSVAAKSLALVIANDNGVAVYNLHDHRKSAVKLHRDGHTVHVTPGTTAMFFHPTAGSFEDVNPAAFVLYRGAEGKVLHNNKAKLFRAEFEVISLLNALPAFKEMMASESDETRKQMSNVLKTAAILMQLKNGGEAFKTYIKPEVTASAK